MRLAPSSQLCQHLLFTPLLTPRRYDFVSGNSRFHRLVYAALNSGARRGGKGQGAAHDEL